MFLAALIPPQTAEAAGPSADIRVMQTVHQGAHLPPPGPPLEGDIAVFQPFTVYYEITNDGPDETTVRFAAHPEPRADDPRYSVWTHPVERTATWYSTEGDDCDHPTLKCRFRLAPGGTFAFMVWMKGNAPGRFSIYGTASSSVADPDSSDNTTSTFEASVVCSINGTSGDDALKGTSDRDSICGFGGDDVLVAMSAGDRIFGGAGDDFLRGDRRNQTFVGGAGRDTVSYSNAARGVMVFLNAKVSTGWGSDTLVAVENADGSRYRDYLEGTNQSNQLKGGRGDDELLGQGGSDVLRGGPGQDEFRSNDQAADLADGGRGRDEGLSDDYDVLRSLNRIWWVPFEDRDP